MKEQDELARFGKWLEERRLADRNEVSHYVRWVKRFVDLRRTRPREVWQDTLTVYVEDLGDGGYKPWQIRQGANAVTLFFGQFRGRSGTPASPEGDTRAEARRKVERRRGPASPEAKASVPATEAAGAKPKDGPAREPAREAVLTHVEMLAELRRILRLRHYAASTERTYVGWCRRFLRYVGQSGEHLPSSDDVQAFLSHLAVQGQVSSSTQNQAFHAVLFLLRHVLMTEAGDLSGTVRAREGRKLPVVLMPEETRAVLEQLKGKHRLMLELVYGAGLRLGELLDLRVKDVDFEANTLTVRASKGDKDRVTFLPKRLVEQLKEHLEEVRRVHERDLAAGAGEAPLPGALARKYPNAGREWGWQYVFPAGQLKVDETGTVRRMNVAAAPVQRAMKRAVRQSGVAKPASVHSLRHSYATALLMKGADIRRVQDLLGHKSVETTMIYTHVLQSMAPDLASPLDEL